MNKSKMHQVGSFVLTGCRNHFQNQTRTPYPTCGYGLWSRILRSAFAHCFYQVFVLYRWGNWRDTGAPASRTLQYVGIHTLMALRANLMCPRRVKETRNIMDVEMNRFRCKLQFQEGQRSATCAFWNRYGFPLHFASIWKHDSKQSNLLCCMFEGRGRHTTPGQWQGQVSMKNLFPRAPPIWTCPLGKTMKGGEIC